MGIKMSQQSITIDGTSKMYLTDGTQASNKVLVSDVDGMLGWRNPCPSTFNPVISVFPTNSSTTYNVSALPFTHYYTVGERGSLDGGHIINLPTTPTNGDMIRVTNTSFAANYIYITSSVHKISYNQNPSNDTILNAGTYLRLYSALTIELTYATKHPSYPTINGSSKPQFDSWYVTNLTGLKYVP
jgi:hypothetical protein